MELKTKINAEENRQELHITRDFDLPVELLFKAYVEPELVEQWMNTRVLKLECIKHGSWEIKTLNPQGQVAFTAGGVFHDVVPDKKIIRTFEMSNALFGVQLEIYDFEKITETTSRLRMHLIYESVEKRNQLLKLPFAQGLNMAHNRIQEILNNLK